SMDCAPTLSTIASIVTALTDSSSIADSWTWKDPFAAVGFVILKCALRCQSPARTTDTFVYPDVFTFRRSWFDASGSTAMIRASGDRKGTRLNSSHVATSYAVCCLQ